MRSVRALTAALCAAVCFLAHPAAAFSIEEAWNFDDPAASESRFRAALAEADAPLKLELLTQIARSFGLRRRFEEAHALLDQVQAELANHSAPRVQVRYLLERGRTLRSSGKSHEARPLFVDAWQRAREAKLDGLAVDAAHMVAIVEVTTADALAWNERAMTVAKTSAEPYAQQWQASLHNNIGWTLHDAGRCEDAQIHFDAALAERRARAATATRIRSARWAVARNLRSLGRLEQALAEQRSLEAEDRAAGKVDADVQEELGELLDASGRADEAKHHFAAAASALAGDSRADPSQERRLQRLRDRGATTPAASR
jgi:tetratricopeptide (TPR) repeat protein